MLQDHTRVTPMLSVLIPMDRTAVHVRRGMLVMEHDVTVRSSVLAEDQFDSVFWL